MLYQTVYESRYGITLKPQTKRTSEGKKQGAVSQPYVSVSFAIEDYISVETLPHYLLESGRKLHQVKGDVPFLITPSPGE